MPDLAQTKRVPASDRSNVLQETVLPLDNLLFSYSTSISRRQIYVVSV